MSNAIFKRLITVGIFTLLIISNINSISVDANTILSGKFNHGQLSLNDEYLLVEWKFDEGEGPITHDTSGHGYDGQISGASWTTVEDGYALDYDGSDDYVSFKNHSVSLGFNKTDDLIFSFWFKSSSTSKGIIYGMSASSDYNPGFHIALNADGRIEVRAWVLGCGFIIKSENSYNDGDWHFVEIWYNGISAKPTVIIYVDGEHDHTEIHWVCPFEYDEFKRNKLGRNSYNTSWPFNGLIDEVRIIKYPGGNQQEPPEISGPIEGDPGEELSFAFTTNDPEGDEIWLYVDWDDGTDSGWIGPYDSGEEVILTHIYHFSGFFTIEAESKDIWDDSSSSYHEVNIGDTSKPPDKPIISGPESGSVEIEYKFTFISTDYDDDDLYYFVDWGDNSNTGWIGPYPSGQEIYIMNSWIIKGDYEITAKAKDINDVESEWSSKQIRIGNEAPIVPIITGETNGEVDIDYEYSIISSDPEEDNLYFDILWGDGLEITDFGPYESGAELRMTHSWGKKGSYTIKARACDGFGACSDWGELKISMPKYNYFNLNINIFKLFLKIFPNFIEILKLLSI